MDDTEYVLEGDIMKTAEQKRQMNRKLGLFGFLNGKNRTRDGCPKWVKEEALEKAKTL